LFDDVKRKSSLTLTDKDKRHIIRKVRNLPKGYFQVANVTEAFNMLTDTLAKDITKSRSLLVSVNSRVASEYLNEYQQASVSEVYNEVPSYVDQMKQGDVSIEHILGINTISVIQRLLNPNGNLKRHYVHLDSRYRVLENTNTASFNIIKWNYAETTNQRDGFITSAVEIKNIKAIRLYQTRIPWDTGSAGFPTMRCISLLFHEFASQSIITHTQRKFHFLLQMLWSEATTVTGVELYPESERDSVYVFQKPFLTFSNLTCSFATPYTLHNIYHDRGTCTFTYGTTTDIVCNQAHLFDAATWITITGFTTNTISVDNDIINSINSPYGHSVSVINATTLRILYINTTSITPTVGLTANIYFDRRRIHIPLEFICIE
jgi:hypothetical protein